MQADRFDQISRLIGASSSRRNALKLLFAAGAGAVIAAQTPQAEAATPQISCTACDSSTATELVACAPCPAGTPSTQTVQQAITDFNKRSDVVKLISYVRNLGYNVAAPAALYYLTIDKQFSQLAIEQRFQKTTGLEARLYLFQKSMPNALMIVYTGLSDAPTYTLSIDPVTRNVVANNPWK